MMAGKHRTGWQLIALSCLALFFTGCAAQKSAQPAAKPAETIVTLPIIGEAEFVTIEPQGLRLAARIDTGATTSSISATQIKNFERDGKKWVSFVITDPVSKQAETLKRPLVRVASIKRHGAKDQERPVVSLQVNMGPIKQKSEFSLTDRSRFEFPVLIGRTYLRNKAIVDVSHEYILSPLGEK